VGRVIASLILLVVAVVACVRAARAHAPPETVSSDEAALRQAYAEVTSREPSERRQAALNFPGSNWSQQDDFHAAEKNTILGFAAAHGVSVSTVTRALDQGMREVWPTRAGIVLSQRVIPCRPRLTY
jgi:hypothetical protein